MKRDFFLLIALLILPIQNICSQSITQSEIVSGQRKYIIGIAELPDTVHTRIDEALERNKDLLKSDSRSVVASLIAINRSAFVSKLTTTAENILGNAITRIGDRLTNSRAKWEQAVGKECFFSVPIGMHEEVKDFYSDISMKGALDPKNIKFDGFECKQDIVIDSTHTINVFYVSCKIDTSKISRMITHSKFEVSVDEVRFNPYICDLPNDSLKDVSKRIAFDFQRREDLRLKIHANVTSSWINEGAVIFNNQKLGEFDIEIKIDSNIVLNSPDKVFTYSAKNAEDSVKKKFITVSGESFVVPRSYAGNYGEDNNSNYRGVWGTGQYKIDMIVTESCKINLDYYTDTISKNNNEPTKELDKPAPQQEMGSMQTSRTQMSGKWNDNWQSEWKLMCSRKKGNTFWHEAWSIIKTQWAGDKWITEVTSPTTTYLIKEGGNFINGGVSSSTQQQQQQQQQSPR